ncbi:MAG TPA: c-type cytochrome domain-containing protein, partial [Chthoniobacteraceae bacterium]|nr:c-type cytochrome domain-containing protein [Chthoniobacteraceae bacterium]
MKPRGNFGKLLRNFFTMLLCAAAARGAGIPIAPLERSTPVDFEREVLPFLRDNCLACHSQTTKKGGLNLETPELMLKGGDTGPAIAAGNGGESLALQAAAHQDADLKMPPRDNKAKAKNLTSEQLALLKLWIDQGAKPSPKTEREIRWQPLPAGLSAIFAVAVTPDGQFAACARGNRLAIYHLPTGRCVASEEAHRDQINALAFSPDGTRLASGGYREVKVWRRPREVPGLNIPDAGVKVAVSSDGKWLATGGDDGSVKLWEFPTRRLARTFAAAQSQIAALSFSPDGARLVCGSSDKSLSIWNVANGNQLAKIETPSEVNAVVWPSIGIASGGGDGTIRLWSETLAPLKELTGHSGALTALDARGPSLLSGGADGSVRMWDAEKGAALVQMAHGGPVTSVAIRADGKRFASAGLNNLARLWDEAGKPVGELRGNRRASEFSDERDRWLQVANSNASYRKSAQTDAEKQLQAAQERVKKSADAIAPKQQDLEAKQKAFKEATDAKSGAEQALAAADEESKKAGEALVTAEKAAQEAAAAVEALKTATPPDQAAIDKAAADAVAKVQD